MKLHIPDPKTNMPSTTNFPQTIDSAVRVLLGLLSPGDLEKITRSAESELESEHYALGQWIRNNLGLWAGNTALMNATCTQNADDASGVIMRALWRHLHDGLPKVH